jgi:hypothetical protein
VLTALQPEFAIFSGEGCSEDAGVVLAVELGDDGYGDVPDGSHGLTFPMALGVSFASHLQCAPREGNYLQDRV